MNKNTYISLWNVTKRECHRLTSRPLYLYCMVIAPVICDIFFTTFMSVGMPVNIPIGLVDQDQTKNSRQIARNLDAFEHTEIIAHYPNVNKASNAMQKAKIYGFYYIPEGTSSKLQAQRRPTLSFYTNNSYLVVGSLLFKDMKMMSELASGAATREILYAKGATEEQAIAYLQPIAINSIPLNNPWINYSIYLNNTYVPAMLMIITFLVTVYTIGIEIKEKSAREWLKTGNNSIYISLLGKLLPQTVILYLMGILYDIYLYRYLHFPCNSGILPMLFATFCLVVASQGVGLIMISIIPSFRLGLSFASLWGVLSFSICGLSFPSMAQHPILQGLSVLFPLRHYFLIYVNQALNGYSMIYAWSNYLGLALFMILPLLLTRRLKRTLLYYKYIP